MQGSHRSKELPVLRPATAADLPFMEGMLAFAAYWRAAQPPPLAEVLADPHNAIYTRDWGRPGDSGFVAEVDGSAAGAAWYRLFRAVEAGYGFINEGTPEITVAVEPSFRRRGLAAALLEALAQAALEAGFGALSLSVERENPAVRIYLRAGYEVVAEMGQSWTMRKLLGPGLIDPERVRSREESRYA